MCNRFIIFFLLFFSIRLQADVYHNIRGFYGLRASGMGGAFTAISDDPSGAVYNPAGLGFMFYKKMTISSIGYQEGLKTITKINGYDRDYNIKSSGFSPNFIGSSVSFGKLKFSVSVLSPTTDNYDQSDQLYSPINVPYVSHINFDFMENNSIYQFGPTLAYLINEKFSIGATLLGFLDTMRNSQKLMIREKSGHYLNHRIDLRRETKGVKPILGFQYMPSHKWSFGVSIQNTFVTNQQIRYFEVNTNQDMYSERLLNVIDQSDTKYGELLGNPNPNERIPQNLYFTGKNSWGGGFPKTHEIRLGVARFISNKFLMVFDTIYTSGYRAKKDLFRYDPFSNILIYQGNEYTDLHFVPTLNFSMGMEYFITPKIAIRLGHFTNNANSKEISWKDYTIDKEIYDNVVRNGQIAFAANDGIVIYNIAKVHPPNRNEHVNLKGFSFGMSWETDTSALGITYVYEKGIGHMGVGFFPWTEMIFQESKVYFTSTIRN